MYEIIKEKRFEDFYSIYQKEDFIKVLGLLRNYLNYRSYYKLSSNGVINEKNPNLFLLNLVFNNGQVSKEVLEEFFNKGILFGENRKLKKIDRLSSEKVEDLEKKLFKIYSNRDLSISLRYTKELIKKDKNLAKKLLCRYVLLHKNTSKKALVLLGFFKSLDLVKDDEDLDTVLHIFLDYIVTYPSEFSDEKEDIDNIYTKAYKKVEEIHGEEVNVERVLYEDGSKRVEEVISERLSGLDGLY